MVLIGRRLSAIELQAVLDDPATVDALLFGDPDDEDGEMPEPELDLGKSWHVIHYRYRLGDWRRRRRGHSWWRRDRRGHRLRPGQAAVP
jgi:hypothetical protein